MCLCKHNLTEIIQTYLTTDASMAAENNYRHIYFTTLSLYTSDKSHAHQTERHI